MEDMELGRVRRVYDVVPVPEDDPADGAEESVGETKPVVPAGKDGAGDRGTASRR